MTAVLAAADDAPRYGLAHIAHRVVMWYSARMWTLPLLLVALPFAVRNRRHTGCSTLLRSCNHEVELPDAAWRSLGTVPARLATLFVTWATLTSVGTLAIVVLHRLAN